MDYLGLRSRVVSSVHTEPSQRNIEQDSQLGHYDFGSAPGHRGQELMHQIVGTGIVLVASAKLN